MVIGGRNIVVILDDDDQFGSLVDLVDLIKKGERLPEYEHIIREDPFYSYCYAFYVIKGRWPEGEEAILKSVHYSYWYARDVIGGRWPEGEEAILRDWYYARVYAYLGD